MKPNLEYLPYSELAELLEYYPLTGLFVWKIRRSQRILAGSPAGFLSKSTGYWNLGINGRYYVAHRVAWMMMHKSWPINYIDHIDGNKLNNRIENLRDVSFRKNTQNKQRHREGRLMGATYHKRLNKWTARLQVNGVNLYLGIFNTEQEAHEAYLKALNDLS